MKLHLDILKRHKLFILLSFISLIIISIFIYFYSTGKYRLFFVSKNPIITLTKSGFQPNNIIIKNGTVVLFKSNIDTLFWPASNSHPYHDLYRDFDPKKALKGTDTWSFKFDQVGEWGFHDHLQPNFTGTIFVLDDSGRLPALADCTKLFGEEQDNCLYNGLKKVVEKEGVKAGFDQFIQIYTKYGKTFGTDCHQISHLLGEITYRQYKKNTSVNLPTEMLSMCGYGFFHGYINALVGDGQDLSIAKDFCQELGKNGNTSENNCFHGVGHAIFDSIDYSLWGNDVAMVDKAISLCRKMAHGSDYPPAVLWCADGVYSSLGVAYSANFYNLSFNNINPFSLCDKQPEEFRQKCYYSPGTFWIQSKLGDNFNLSEAFKITENIRNRQGYDLLVMSLTRAYYKANLDKKKPIEILKECINLEPEYKEACVRGVVYGMLVTDSIEYKEDSKKLCDTVASLGDDVKAFCLKNTTGD